jgi:serine/threonine-protein kinase
MNELQASIYEFGDFRVDAAKRRLLGRNGEPVPLTPKVFDTLLYLVEHPGTVLNKDELMEAIWPQTVVEENSLNQSISILRRVLGESRGENRYIVTVPGRGYRFVAEVRSFTGRKDETEDESVQAASQTDERAGGRRSRVSLTLIAGITIVGLSLAAFYLWRATTRTTAVSRINSMAVLPFKPLVAEHRNESLELGMADALIARLSGREIIVRPLSSVRKYSGLEQDPLAAGRELGVESVLDGNIQIWGERIRVTARLIAVGDGKQLWAGQFYVKSRDIFPVQDSISERVAAALTLQLSGEEKQRLTKRYTENAEAYELYMKGRYFIGSSPEQIRRSIEYYQRAIEVDPSYALAYAGLAEAYRTLPLLDLPSREAFPKAKAAAAKALEIDETLAEAHTSLGTIKFWFDWDWDGSEKEFKRAIDLNPNNADAHRSYAHLLSNLGRHGEAIAEMKRAREIDPLSLIINALEGLFLHYAQRDDEAIARLEKTFEIDPNYWVAHINLAKVYTGKRMYDEAIAELNKAREFSGGNTETISLLGYALAISGKREPARATLNELHRLSAERYVPPYNIAMVYCGLDESDEALAWLEKAYDERDVRLTFIKVDPKWDKLRSDSRFAALSNRLDLE